MGSVAGSGGYYIACPGRLIFAEPTTITGSIGVLAILANQSSLLNRSDINLYEMKRGRRSLLGSGHRDLPPDDRRFLQDYILKTYDQFIDRVAEG
ncbi:MAG: S49 family peptidase, partial [Phycisphaerae bacterium]